jgi:phospholipase/carboxylesterase
VKNPPLLVLLHGEGGNEKELLDLFQEVDDRFVIVSLRAPFIQLENKYLWYSTSRSNDNYIANPAQLEYSRLHIISDVQRLIAKHSCDQNQVYYFGFGQGGVMAIDILLTVPDRVAGVAVLNSHFLPELRASMPPGEKIANKSILICHGKYNQIIPIEMGRKLKYELSTLPVVVDYQEFEIGHFYSKECNTYIKDWFTFRLNDAKVPELPVHLEYSTKLAAYQLNVRDIDRSIVFYERYVGMRLVERTGKAFAFLSNNQAHHVIELQLSDAFPDNHNETLLGYRAVQFEVPDKLSFARAYWNLTEGGISISATDRIICWQLKFSDPDGNIINIIWDTRHLPNRSDIWHGRELPLEKETILDILILP